MVESLLSYNSENLSNAGIESPRAEEVKDSKVPPPKTIGVFIKSVALVFIDALKGFELLKKCMADELVELLFISSKGHTISAESRKMSLL